MKKRIKSSHKHRGVKSIDYYACLSEMRSWNPVFKVVFSLTTLLFCVAADSMPVSVLVFLSMMYLTVSRGGVPVRDYLSLFTVPAAFMIMSSIAIAFGISSQPAGEYRICLYWFYIYTSRTDVVRMLMVLLKAAGAVSALYMMVLSTPVGELIYVLRRFHIPKLIIELMHLIYRFIFILLDVQGRMHQSAEARLGYAGFCSACRSFGNISGSLLIISFKKANAYYDAMLSRCYDGDLVFLEEEHPVCRKQVAVGAAYVAALVMVRILCGIYGL